MKTKSKSLKQSRYWKLKTSLALSFKFCFCVFRFSFFVSCFLSSLVGAEIPPEQIDPTDFLALHFLEAPKYVNTPSVAVETSMDVNKPGVPIRVAKLPSGQHEQPQIRSDSIGGSPVEFYAQAHQELPNSSFPIVGNFNSQLGRQLWQAWITVAESEKNKQSRNQLKRIIEQVRSVEFEPQNKPSKPLIVVESMPIYEPDETLLVTELLDQPVEEIESKQQPLLDDRSQSANRLPYEPVSDQTLQMLDDLLQHPDRLNNPLEMGEVLFLSGNRKEAATFYQEALNRKSPDKTGSVQDRAWILFQIGNCLRHDDPPTAAKMYRQLIAEYPDSAWTDLAKVQDKLIDWYQKDKPRTLIVERQF